MGDNNTEDNEEEEIYDASWQLIPHSSSKELNGLLHKDYQHSLDLELGEVFANLPNNFDFIYPDPAHPELVEAHELFIDYINQRVNKNVKEELAMHIIHHQLNSSENFDFVDENYLADDEQHKDTVAKSHREFIKHVKNRIFPNS